MDLSQKPATLSDEEYKECKRQLMKHWHEKAKAKAAMYALPEPPRPGNLSWLLDNIYLCYEAAVVPIECDISETHEIATTLTFLDSGSCSLTIDDLEQDSALVAKVTSSPIQTSVALLHDAWWEDIRETNDQSARQKVARLQYCLDCGSRLVRETTLAHFCQDRGLGGKGCQERYAKFIKRSKANWKKMQTLRTSNHPAWTDEQKKLNRTINKRLAEIRIRVHTGKIRDNSKDVQDWT